MDKLKSLNLKEVAAKTQIEKAFLEALVANDFEKISRFNVKGFLKILTRDYGCDFSEFLQEYENYLNQDSEQQVSKNEPVMPISTQIDSYTPEQKSKWWVFVLLLLILVVGAWFVYEYKLLNLLTPKKDNIASATVMEQIDKAQDNIKQVSIQKDSTEDEKIDNNTSVAQGQGDNTAQENTNQNIKENNQTQAKGLDLNNRLTELNTQSTLHKEAIISTNGKVWVGFINLQTRGKNSMVTDQNFSVDLSKDQLLLIGATALTIIDEEGQIKEFPAGESKRFLVQNGRIKAINLAEFRALNRGREW